MLKHKNVQLLCLKDTFDFKNIEAVIFGTATEDEKYNERDLLNIIAGVMSDKDIGGFGIEDRSLLGVTLYDVDLDEDWEEIAAFNFEDEGTRNFWRHRLEI